MARLPSLTEEPAGLVHRAAFLTPAEEQDLLPVLESLTFGSIEMHGRTARRGVAEFGWRYGFESWTLEPADPLPQELVWLRERCADLAGVAPDALAEALVTRYPPGAGIGWHRDAPVFGPVVIGVSLRSACRMRFQRREPDVVRRWELPLAARSAYVLSGPVRSAWQHSIPPVEDLRYSVTFRTLRRPPGRA